ncbi:hypothetical protein HK103_004351 [Boothiomyces macroporosus]|uniref:FHF complex subunit HOOK-interacting protein C-terminal domain-containing protein n=1 Tax=Boothiomyces macroporosus TaxID=261099 RepID=A0AAD5Y452_9FUNG|nr:hypothetical protein HK103_004351 [Boothiomyces macroporosus]
MDLFGDFKSKLLSISREAAKVFEEQTPIEQFKSAWKYALEELKSPYSEVQLRNSLDEMLDLLLMEQAKNSKTNETGSCTEFFLKNEILGQMILAGNNKRIISFASQLVNMMDSHFLYNAAIHGPITKLLKDQSLGEQLIELEYHLSLKILESPELLQLFFLKPSNGHPQFSIFDHLIQFVHLDTENGDFARAAFEMLLCQCAANSDLEGYILQTEFSSIIVASLAGLHAQLPVVLPNISNRNKHNKEIFEADMKAFISFYKFVHMCLTKCPSDKIGDAIIKQFTDLFLAQVVFSTLNSCSDFDGSTVTSLYYIQTMIELTVNQKMFEAVTRFLLESSSIDDLDGLRARDILLSKLNSLSEDVVTSVMQILTSILTHQSNLAVSLLFEKCELVDVHLPVKISDHMELLNKYIPLLPKGTGPQNSNLDAYLADAISTMLVNKPLQKDASAVKDTDFEAEEEKLREKVAQLKTDPTLNKILQKFGGFFQHSMKINLALTGIITILATQPNQVLFSCLFEESDSTTCPSIHTIFTKLIGEVEQYKATIPNYEIRLPLIKQSLNDDLLSDFDQERELIRNIICFEEFIKEIVACLLMRAGSAQQSFSFV